LAQRVSNELYDKGGELALQEISRKNSCFKHRVDEQIELAVVDMAIKKPAFGKLRGANELRKQVLHVSSDGDRSIWIRHDLETFQKRLKALQAKMVQETFILTEDQLKHLEKAKEEKQILGEIETAHLGYLLSQDTYYLGNIKEVGRVYQQTMINTYSKVSFAKLYERKNVLIDADVLNDLVFLWFDTEDVRILRHLTDIGTEYCGSR
jgi:hypothetical protein